MCLPGGKFSEFSRSLSLQELDLGQGVHTRCFHIFAESLGGKCDSEGLRVRAEREGKAHTSPILPSALSLPGWGSGLRDRFCHGPQPDCKAQVMLSLSNI